MLPLLYDCKLNGSQPLLQFELHPEKKIPEWCLQASECCDGNLRHQQVSPSVRQAAAGGRASLLVVATVTTQQAEDVKGHHQDDHAEHRHAGDPPEG